MMVIVDCQEHAGLCMTKTPVENNRSSYFRYILKYIFLALSYSTRDPASIINSAPGLYSACGHISRFHKYQPNYISLSTDDKHTSLERIIVVDSKNTHLLFDENLMTCTHIPDNVHDT